MSKSTYINNVFASIAALASDPVVWPNAAKKLPAPYWVVHADFVDLRQGLSGPIKSKLLIQITRVVDVNTGVVTITSDCETMMSNFVIGAKLAGKQIGKSPELGVGFTDGDFYRLPFSFFCNFGE